MSDNKSYGRVWIGDEGPPQASNPTPKLTAEEKAERRGKLKDKIQG